MTLILNLTLILKLLGIVHFSWKFSTWITATLVGSLAFVLYKMKGLVLTKLFDVEYLSTINCQKWF